MSAMKSTHSANMNKIPKNFLLSSLNVDIRYLKVSEKASSMFRVQECKECKEYLAVKSIEFAHFYIIITSYYVILQIFFENHMLSGDFLNVIAKNHMHYDITAAISKMKKKFIF